MRHQVAGFKLGRTKSARIALRRNLIKQLFTHERIQTTKAKAAAIRGEAEKLITLARNHIQLIVGKLAPLFLDIAFELFPVAFNTVPVHFVLLYG